MKKNLVIAGCGVLILFLVVSWAHFFTGLRLEREIRLPSGLFYSARAITQTSDDSYVIAGMAARVAVAIKINSSGQVLWTYKTPKEKFDADYSFSPNHLIEASFYGATPASDGGVLLCGFVLDHGDGSTQNPMNYSGIAVLLDKDGNPKNPIFGYHYADGSYVDNQTTFDTCTRWGDGFAIIGDAPHAGVLGPKGGGNLLIRLNSEGVILSQNLINIGNRVRIESPQVLSNQNLVVEASGEVGSIDTNGKMQTHRMLGPACYQTTQVSNSDALRYVCTQPGAASAVQTRIQDLDKDLQLIRTTRYSASNMSLHKALANPDGSMILFGSTESLLTASAFVPTIMEYAPDGAIASTYRFRRPWSDGWFVDGIPTGRPNEYAGLRCAVEGQQDCFVDFMKR